MFQTKMSVAMAWKMAPLETIWFQIPAAVGLVGVDAARHSQHTGDVHEVEGEMKADEEEPEVPLAQLFAQTCGRSSWDTSNRRPKRA
jgi:hypothetical protein